MLINLAENWSILIKKKGIIPYKSHHEITNLSHAMCTQVFTNIPAGSPTMSPTMSGCKVLPTPKTNIRTEQIFKLYHDADQLSLYI